MSSQYVSYLYTIFSANPSKITTVIISLATAVSETSLPLLAGLKYKSKDNQGSIKKLLLENYRLLLFVLLPLVSLAAFASSPIFVKIVLQVPMTMFMSADGAILSTDIAFLLVIVLSYHKLDKTYDVNLHSLLPIVVVNEIYIILLFIYQLLIGYHFNSLGRMGSFIYLAIFGLVFLGIYILLANVMGTSETIFGKIAHT